MLSLQVKGMTCGHCVKAVTQAIQEIDTTAEVTVDLAQGRVDVDSKAAPQAITEAIAEAGYEVVDAP